MTTHEARDQFQHLVTTLLHEIPITETVLRETIQMLAEAALACAGHDRTFGAQMLSLTGFLNTWAMDNHVEWLPSIFTFNNHLYPLACTIAGMPIIEFDLPDPMLIEEDDDLVDPTTCKLSVSPRSRRRHTR